MSAFYFWPSENAVVTKETTHEKVVSPNRKLFRGKRKNLSNDKKPEVQTCDVLLTQLNDLDLSGEELNDFDKLNFDGCDAETVKLAKEVCSETKFEKCLTQIVFLRAKLRTRGIETSEDPEMVADLIITEFNKTPPNFNKLEKLVGELLEQNPENKNFQKLWAMNKFLANIDKKPLPANLKESIYERVDPEVLDDPEFMSYRMFLETGLDPSRAEEFSRSLVEQFPNRADAHEVLGWSLWQQNRRAEAITELERAIRLAPHDEWLRRTYKNVKDPKADRGAYQGRMSIGVKLEDLYQ